VLNFKPSRNARNPYKMAYRSYGKSALSGVKLPNVSTVINLALIGGVGLIGYKLYNKFFGGADSIISSALDTAKTNGAKAIAK
ncbi:hypothetical protein ACPXAM_24100, partial [Escherichia coli]|uniref:hypothetical protein n=1 Tax=Escherichia coli TaxID=562 RepID=UPI003CE5248D